MRRWHCKGYRETEILTLTARGQSYKGNRVLSSQVASGLGDDGVAILDQDRIVSDFVTARVIQTKPNFDIAGPRYRRVAGTGGDVWNQALLYL